MCVYLHACVRCAVVYVCVGVFVCVPLVAHLCHALRVPSQAMEMRWNLVQSVISHSSLPLIHLSDL